MKSSSDEPSAGGAVVRGRGLQQRGVVAVLQFGAQERARAAHGGVVGQVPRAGGVLVVEQTAEEQVVVDALQRAQPAVEEAGPFVQAG